MNDCLSLEKTSVFPRLIVDYLNKKEAPEQFYQRFPSLDNLTAQADVKKNSFSDDQRKLLVQRLSEQYKGLSLSQKTEENIAALKEDNTFTVTTGHQLNLFTGPLYFLYKIISVLNLSEQWNASQQQFQAVPVFWMASEDHDFEEINFFRYKNQVVQWQREAEGPVGRFDLEGLKEVAGEFEKLLKASKQTDYLLEVFTKAYTEHHNLADATRFLANELFGAYGLVIIGGDDASFKKSFAPYAKEELLEQSCNRHLTATNTELEAHNYHTQVHQREINLFYLKDNLRNRILKNERGFAVDETAIEFSEKEILQELDEHPERFSPNAVMRPLYQETILPNLAYIGGAGELSYWFQLKSYFKSQQIPFPILWLRNSALLITEKQVKKANQLNRKVVDFFQNTSDLRSQHTREVSDIAIDFSPQKAHLQKQFSELYGLAKKTDESFEGAVAAQEKKQINGLEHLEKRLLKAQKRKLSNELGRLTELKENLFPQDNLQERVDNFSTFYAEYGEDLIPRLKKELDPLEFGVKLIEFDY